MSKTESNRHTGPSQASVRAQLPLHLQQFVANQDYAECYSAKDQCVWRYVLRHLKTQLQHDAHPVYYEGLTRTGISLEHIPAIEEMNLRLEKLGWRAVAVDGFIPPQAFMELQSLRVLAIALDIRQLEHIDYTPAPDIIHEAAGHAPIIADEEYSDYLQRFGEVGMKAIYNKHDLALYETVREISILKAVPKINPDQLEQAEVRLNKLLANPGKPSELALLTRLHWWTVEYGLVGSPTDYKIFGAGLLSSLSESKSCLDDLKVKKAPLTVDAIQSSYDITSSQPQLFTTRSCRHLTQILETFASTMCYQVGGAKSLQQAIDADVVTTAEYSSGLQVSGLLTRLLNNSLGQCVYLGTEGPTQLSYANKQLEGHDIRYHSAGFGSPVGRICNLMKPLEEASEFELQALNIKRDHPVSLEFLSGVKVEGRLVRMLKTAGKNLLFSFEQCTVTGPAGEPLFEPEWGTYDMAVGETINSVFAGSADPSFFDVYPKKSSLENTVNAIERKQTATAAFYEELLTLIDSTQDTSSVEQLAKRVLEVEPTEWLIQLELLALLPTENRLAKKLINNLEALQKSHADIAQLIERDLIRYSE